MYQRIPFYNQTIQDINNLQNSVMWRSQLTIAINFISFKDIYKQLVMHSERDDIEIMSHDKS